MRIGHRIGLLFALTSLSLVSATAYVGYATTNAIIRESVHEGLGRRNKIMNKSCFVILASSSFSLLQIYEIQT